MKLLGKELKNVMRGILYIVFAGAVILFYATQFGGAASRGIKNAEAGVGALAEPQPGQESYGVGYEEIPEIIMPNAVNALMGQWRGEIYSTYPIGFYKTVRTSESEQAEIAGKIQRITGVDADDLSSQLIEWENDNYSVDENGYWRMNIGADISDAIPIVVDYDEFKALMSEIDDILGGGSVCDPDGFLRYGQVQLTFEQALDKYNTIIYEDKISGAYARLFCDYSGIDVALFAVFLPVGYLLRDRKAKMEQLIYSRGFSSVKLIFTRYLACLLAVMLPVILLGIAPSIQLGLFASRNGLPYNPLAFLLYTLAWIGPIAMVACSVGFFFTILTDTPIGIFVQFLWSFMDFSSGELTGGKLGTKLIPRHNMTGGRDIFDWDGFVPNRIGYTALALVLLGLCILLYEQKRRGRLNVRDSLTKIFRRNKNTVSPDALA